MIGLRLHCFSSDMFLNVLALIAEIFGMLRILSDFLETKWQKQPAAFFSGTRDSDLGRYWRCMWTKFLGMVAENSCLSEDWWGVARQDCDT